MKAAVSNRKPTKTAKATRRRKPTLWPSLTVAASTRAQRRRGRDAREVIRKCIQELENSPYSPEVGARILASMEE